MQPAELELYTIQELITELMSRKTFLGIVVHSDQDFKAEQWSQEGLFKVHYNANLCAAEVSRLLDVVAGHVEQKGD